MGLRALNKDKVKTYHDICNDYDDAINGNSKTKNDVSQEECEEIRNKVKERWG